MKKLIKNYSSILASASVDTVNKMSEQEMLNIVSAYQKSDGNFGSFDGVADLESFMRIMDRLEDLGYELQN